MRPSILGSTRRRLTIGWAPAALIRGTVLSMIEGSPIGDIVLQFSGRGRLGAAPGPIGSQYSDAAARRAG
jgi:hypothetical protein